jgi:hypothetical protein
MVESVQVLEKVDTEKAGNPVFSDIRKEWDWVQVGLREINSVVPHLDHRPEDVYVACVNGDAHLWTTHEGFVITTSEVDTMTGQKAFFIWLAWAKQRGYNLIDKHQPFFADIAKQAGFDKMTTKSAVPQLREHMEANGWHVETVVYSRYLK